MLILIMLWYEVILQSPGFVLVKIIFALVFQMFYIQWKLSKADTYRQKFLSALERCPPWRGLNWKVPKFKVQLFYTGPTLTRTPSPPYLNKGMWNGEKEVIFLVMYQFILHQRLKQSVIFFCCLFLIVMSCSFSVTNSNDSFISPSSYCLVKRRYSRR